MKYFVALLALVTLVQSLSIDDRTLDINVNVEKNSNSYHHGKLREGTFEYGLDVEKSLDHHFQHKVKGPDDVTYGCYGFVDPAGKPHLTHYVSDLKGYRVVAPDQATKIYVARLEKSISNVYQGSVEKNVQWRDLFFPPACNNLYAELEKAASSTVTTRISTPRPITTPRQTTTRFITKPTTSRTTTTPRTTTTAAPPPLEPEFTASSNVHESIVPHGQPQAAACSNVCDDLKGELQEIKSKLKSLIDSLARKDAEEQQAKKKKSATATGGNGTFAYFPVMLSDSLPEGATASGQFALPTFQCGRQ